MPAPATVDEFVDLVRKSNVLDEGRLSAYVQKLKADPTTPKALSGVAGLFVRDGLITYFQAEQFLQGKWKRFTIGKYKVLEKLGSGGMGQVFLCEHKLMRRRVAVKVLPTAKATDQSSLERFYREARAVAALDHPNIVRAYDIDQDDNLHFLVMEYVDGASLQEMIRKTGPMDPTRACHYMYWSAIGLHHAHESGLYHRDIKPGNILVDRQGVVKILDLGLARFFNDDEDMLTKKFDENVLGTADYLAPEQAIDSHAVDGRADIYSMGATFYFLLTGNPPFSEGTVAQKLLWHQNRSPKPVREVRPEVPAEVAFVLQKMMAKKAEDRYQTPAELAEALLPFTQTPIPPPPDAEMPTLSAAAMGTGGPASMASSGPRTMPAPRTPAPTVSAPRTPGPVGLAEADTRRTAGVPIVEPIPDSAPGSPIWEAISAETANATTTDTDRRKREPRSSRRFKGKPKEEVPAKGKSSIKTKAAPKADSKSKLAIPQAVRGMSVPVMVATGVAALILMIGGGVAMWYLFFRGATKTPAPHPSGENRRLVVTKNGGGQPLHFTTVMAAANEFKPGDQIVIADDEWDEAVILTQRKNLVITAAEGKRVTWRIGKDAPAVLSLVNAEATRISGIHFVGGDRVNVVVRLSGRSAGLTLEDVEITGGTTAGLELHDADGEKGKPLTVRRARFQSAPGAGKAAVHFTAPAGGGGKSARGPSTDEVAFEDCTIIGPYTEGGFVFDGAATGVTVRHCRVWKSEVGLRFKRPKPDVSWQVAAIGNTFASLRAGIQCEDIGLMRGTKPETKVRLAQNYFTNCVQVLQIDQGEQNGVAVFAGSEGNARKAQSNPGAQNLFLTDEVTGPDLSENPTDPKAFLTYDRNHPLFKHFGGKPVGVPPE